MAKAGRGFSPKHTFDDSVEGALSEIESMMEGLVPAENSRWFAVKLFERDEKVLDSLSLAQNLKLLAWRIIISRLEKEEDDDAESIITNERYSYIAKLVKSCVQKKKTGMTTSDKIDRIVTNRWLALPIFAVVMTLVYYISWTTVGTNPHRFYQRHAVRRMD